MHVCIHATSWYIYTHTCISTYPSWVTKSFLLKEAQRLLGFCLLCKPPTSPSLASDSGPKATLNFFFLSKKCNELLAKMALGWKICVVSLSAIGLSGMGPAHPAGSTFKGLGLKWPHLTQTVAMKGIHTSLYACLITSKPNGPRVGVDDGGGGGFEDNAGVFRGQPLLRADTEIPKPQCPTECRPWHIRML